VRRRASSTISQETKVVRPTRERDEALEQSNVRYPEGHQPSSLDDRPVALYASFSFVLVTSTY
jgi:hypothetical protein